MIALLLLRSLCPFTVEPGLELSCSAALAWGPQDFGVTRVRWQHENDKYSVFQVSAYIDNREIIVSPQDWGEQGDAARMATLTHEFGHALGLMHSSEHDSIMKPGWDEPISLAPTSNDHADLSRVLFFRSPESFILGKHLIN